MHSQKILIHVEISLDYVGFSAASILKQIIYHIASELCSSRGFSPYLLACKTNFHFHLCNRKLLPNRC